VQLQEAMLMIIICNELLTAGSRDGMSYK